MRNRVSIYIDGSNFYRACQTQLSRADVDIGKLASKLVGTRDLGRTYYYNARVSRRYNQRTYDGQQRFLSALGATPYLEVRLGRHVKRGDTWLEKGVDVRLAVDLVSHAFKDMYDTAILVSGEGDLEYAVRAAKDTGKHVEVAFFKAARSSTLSAASDLVHEMPRSLFRGIYRQRPQL